MEPTSHLLPDGSTFPPVTPDPPPPPGYVSPLDPVPDDDAEGTGSQSPDAAGDESART